MGSIFSMKLLRFVSKAIKLLLTELSVSAGFIPLSLFRNDLLRSVNTEKAAGHIFLFDLPFS